SEKEAALCLRPRGKPGPRQREVEAAHPPSHSQGFETVQRAATRGGRRQRQDAHHAPYDVRVHGLRVTSVQMRRLLKAVSRTDAPAAPGEGRFPTAANCAPQSMRRMYPVTVAAAVKYMTASAMSLTMEGRPFGKRLSITSFGAFRWSGV